MQHTLIYTCIHIHFLDNASSDEEEGSKVTLAYQSEGNTDKDGLKDMGATRQLETEGEVS